MDWYHGKLRCRLGLHRWLKHWKYGDDTDAVIGWGIAGLIIGLFSTLCLAMLPETVIINMTDNQLISVLFSTIIFPPIFGVFIGLKRCLNDKTCIDCHKNDFSYTLRQIKLDAKNNKRFDEEKSARKNYEEIKQFLKL